jgi:Fic family protein
VTATVVDPAENELAFAGYTQAMKYVLQLHDDPHFVYDEGLLRALHFMMLAHDVDKRPGRWRAKPVVVKSRETNELRYEPPPADAVPDLVRELVVRLNEGDDTPVTVRAAMAHLNVVQIHPFTDGNGRMARALQTLVLVREGILDPEFCSLEDDIARNRHAYSESLSDVGRITWDPEGSDARPFVRFCLTAHLHQAQRVLHHARRTTHIWAEATREVRKHRLPDRLAAAVADAALLGEIDAVAYRQWSRGSARSATGDLKMLVDQGVLIRPDGRRGVYQAGPAAQAIRELAFTVHPPQPLLDPFEDRSPRSSERPGPILSTS